MDRPQLGGHGRRRDAEVVVQPHVRTHDRFFADQACQPLDEALLIDVVILLQHYGLHTLVIIASREVS
jgi:hypothetical protein